MEGGMLFGVRNIFQLWYFPNYFIILNNLRVSIYMQLFLNPVLKDNVSIQPEKKNNTKIYKQIVHRSAIIYCNH